MEIIQKFNPDYIVHAAATKFVGLAEKFPMEAVDSNILGSANIARAAIFHNVEGVVGVSTDKVTEPVANFYGLTKSVMEHVFMLLSKESSTIFTCVRYGNVAWSTGSVLPIWLAMSQKEKLITTTGLDASRFFFTINEAVDLIRTSLVHISQLSGTILSLPMKGTNMLRLLEIFSYEYRTPWVVGERRNGDRAFENLISLSEAPRTKLMTLDSKEFLNIGETGNLVEAYSSINAPQLTDEELITIVKSLPN